MSSYERKSCTFTSIQLKCSMTCDNSCTIASFLQRRSQCPARCLVSHDGDQAQGGGQAHDGSLAHGGGHAHDGSLAHNGGQAHDRSLAHGDGHARDGSLPHDGSHARDGSLVHGDGHACDGSLAHGGGLDTMVVKHTTASTIRWRPSMMATAHKLRTHSPGNPAHNGNCLNIMTAAPVDTACS